jgi:4-nitrophenyl phosphatase
MGESGLHRAIKAQGFEVLSAADIKAGAKANVVVGGLMREALNYELLAMGSLLVQRGATFIATNYDSSFPSELGFLPGAGAVLSVVEKSSGVSPTIIGKPNTIMFEEALRRLAKAPFETAMLGDRLNTDIEGGKKAGMQTILVLSGVSTLANVENSSLKPDYIFDDIATLSQALKRLP